MELPAFFFSIELQRLSSSTQERPGVGAGIYDHPVSIFSGLKEKLRAPFMFHLGKARGTGGWTNGEMKGR